MRDHRGSDRRTPEAPMLPTFAWLGPEQLNGVMDAQREVLRQGEAIARLWQESMQDALSSGQTLSSELARCKTPQEATLACTDWLQGRYGRLASDSQEAWRLWLAMAQAATVNGFAGAGETAERKGRAARHEPREDD